VLEPGLGRTRTGRLWVYVRDDRPFCGAAPPAAVYFYSPDRRGEHPATHLAHFTGFLQADAYSGFAALYEPRKASPGFPAMPAITEVACWAHCRRSIFDVWQTTKSTVAKAALDRIAQFYTIEDKARFAPPEGRSPPSTKEDEDDARVTKQGDPAIVMPTLCRSAARPYQPPRAATH
jgi:transposase